MHDTGWYSSTGCCLVCVSRWAVRTLLFWPRTGFAQKLTTRIVAVVSSAFCVPPCPPPSPRETSYKPLNQVQNQCKPHGRVKNLFFNMLHFRFTIYGRYVGGLLSVRVSIYVPPDLHSTFAPRLVE